MTTIEGPDGPVTDTVEMLVGRLGMPDLGGSYFTFSNENNDLIWGFLAEVHRRGWLYKGHDTMPWCPRCGTGLSQMEMNEGYQDREDPGLTVRFPLVDRPGESLLVWTTTPWTLTSNVAAAVGPDLRYVRVRQGDDRFWVGKGTLKTALQGPFTRRGRAGRLRPGGLAVHRARSTTCRPSGRPSPRAYEHRVVPWTEVGEDEGTGIVHIAPGCGSEDFQLGKALGLPVIGADRRGRPVPARLRLAERSRGAQRRRARSSTTSNGAGSSTTSSRTRHRYPHCWRCGTPLLFRLVDEWFISMGPVYDQPRETLTREQVDASLRYQIMEVVDRIRWIPDFGYDRELDWLRNMHDWMISKKRYWGLALPIYDCSACGTVDVIGGREELHERAVDGWDATSRATRRTGRGSTRSRSPARSCGAPVERIKDVGNPWLDAGIVPFSTLHYREDPDFWAQWFPADFITESFPGQFRNWFYSMLAMSTVLKRTEPFKTIFGYATLFGEDGRPMHKSWGNAIEFDEAADRMGVDVMRWMFAKARPEENILFGWHAADEARRELLVLWNVYSFFVTYARLAGWTPDAQACPVRRAPGPRSLDPVARGGDGGGRRGAAARRRCGRRRPAPCRSSWTACRRGTCGCRDAASRARTTPPTEAAAFATLHEALVATAGCWRRSCRSWPTRSTPTSSTRVIARRSRQRPPHAVADGRPGRHRDETPRGVDGQSRRLPSTSPGRSAAPAHLRTRQPLAEAWLALPDRGLAFGPELLRLIADEINVKRVTIIEDGSALVERRVKPLLPKIGKRLGASIPAVMAAARSGDVAVRRGWLGHARRRDPRARRGRGPGDAATRDGRRGERRPRGRARHGADAGAGRRGRCPRAPAGDPGPAQGGGARARRPDRPVGGRAAGTGRSSPRRPSPPRRSR